MVAGIFSLPMTRTGHGVAESLDLKGKISPHRLSMRQLACNVHIMNRTRL